MQKFLEWAKSPRGLIILTIGAVILIYIVLRKGASTSAAATDATTGGTTGAGDNTDSSLGSFNGPHNPSGDGEHDGTGSLPITTTTAPTSDFPKTATVRASTGSTYDNQYKGVYYFTDANKTKSVSTVPFGSTVTLIGSTTGVPYSSGSSITTWYQLANGYWISAHDLIGL